MALAEGAALDVLAGEAHRDAFGKQRGVSELLCVCPVDAAVGADGLTATLELLDQLGVHVEAFGHGEQLGVEAEQALLVDSGGDVRGGRTVELVLARLLGDRTCSLSGLDAVLEVVM